MLDVGAFDQARQTVLDYLVPHWAGVLRAFKSEAGVSEEEALALTLEMMRGFNDG